MELVYEINGLEHVRKYKKEIVNKIKDKVRLGLKAEYCFLLEKFFPAPRQLTQFPCSSHVCVKTVKVKYFSGSAIKYSGH